MVISYYYYYYRYMGQTRRRQQQWRHSWLNVMGNNCRCVPMASRFQADRLWTLSMWTISNTGAEREDDRSIVVPLRPPIILILDTASYRRFRILWRHRELLAQLWEWYWQKCIWWRVQLQACLETNKNHILAGAVLDCKPSLCVLEHLINAINVHSESIASQPMRSTFTLTTALLYQSVIVSILSQSIIFKNAGATKRRDIHRKQRLKKWYVHHDWPASIYTCILLTSSESKHHLGTQCGFQVLTSTVYYRWLGKAAGPSWCWHSENNEDTLASPHWTACKFFLKNNLFWETGG